MLLHSAVDIPERASEVVEGLVAALTILEAGSDQATAAIPAGRGRDVAEGLSEAEAAEFHGLAAGVGAIEDAVTSFTAGADEVDAGVDEREKRTNYLRELLSSGIDEELVEGAAEPLIPLTLSSAVDDRRLGISDLLDAALRDAIDIAHEGGRDAIDVEEMIRRLYTSISISAYAARA